MSMMNPVIMLVGKYAVPLEELIKEFMPSFYQTVCTDDPLEALRIFPDVNPSAVVVSAHMDNLNGYSFVAILRGSVVLPGMGANIPMYIVDGDGSSNEPKATLNVRVERLFTAGMSPEMLVGQIKMDIGRANLLVKGRERRIPGYDGLQSIFYMQNSKLPAKISRDDGFRVSWIFSPYSRLLSGDGFDYWLSKDGNELFGFLFDCTGHDLGAASQVKELCLIYHIYFRENRDNLSFAIGKINEAMFGEYGMRCQLSAGFLFRLNIAERTLEYCSAGIPEFYVVRNGNLECVSMEGPLVGLFPESKYKAVKMTAENIDEFIFATDGFMDLVGKSIAELKVKEAKHDDTTVIFVTLPGAGERGKQS